MTARKSSPPYPNIGKPLLIHMSLVVLIITLAPYRFGIPRHFTFSAVSTYYDIMNNIFLFLPIGFFFQLSQRASIKHSTLKAFLIGAGFSLVIEMTQLFLPARYSSAIDIMSNSSGAWIGAALCRHLSRQQTSMQMYRKMALDLPLTGSVYLLTPLLWLSSYSIGHDNFRIWISILPATIGCLILATIHINRTTSRNVASKLKTVLLAGFWVLCGIVLMILRYPIYGMWICGISGGLTFYFIALFEHRSKRERRFERPTLAKIIPLFISYLLLISILPADFNFSVWHYTYGFNVFRPFQYIDVSTFRVFEMSAAYIILGYISAEIQGRKHRSLIHILSITLIVSAATALGCGVLRGFNTHMAFSVSESAVAIASGGYGGILYITVIQPFVRKTQ